MAFREDKSPAAQNQAPLSSLVAAWGNARERWIEAANKPGAGNFDTAECVFWREEIERFQELIELAKVQSQEDAAAMIRFIWLDADAPADEWPQVRRSALAKMKDWAVTA